MKILQKGFNYSQDGPGNRLVYHLQGCNFKCKWCSNPESMTPDSKSAQDTDDDYIIEEIKRSRMMFFDGGGVTFTGGEPTLQFDSLKKILQAIKSEGINTAIETNGSHPKLCELSGLVDYLIMDIKQPDDEIHKKFVAHSNKQTLKNLELLTESGREMHLRIPLINGVNTDPEVFVRLFKSVDMSKSDIEILPYHEYGKCKWTKEYEITDGFVNDETLKHFTSRLTDEGFKIIKT